MSFVTNWVLSRIKFLSFVTIKFFEICHNLSLVIILLFEFFHNLSFWILSRFEFLSFVTIFFFFLHLKKISLTFNFVIKLFVSSHFISSQKMPSQNICVYLFDFTFSSSFITNFFKSQEFINHTNLFTIKTVYHHFYFLS